jgi:hypothetical protein
MSKSYTIQWKSMENGRTGTGTKLFDLSEAEDLAEELNTEYPDIHHEVVEVDASSQTISAPMGSDSEELGEAASEGIREPEHMFSFQEN